jgi:putative ABC transport system permease protein
MRPWWRTFRKPPTGDLEREIEFHAEQLTREKIARGVAPARARREANIELGGAEQIKEAVRDVHRIPLLDGLSTRLRYGLRALRARPSLSLAVIATLALGVGANTAVFSVIDAVLLRPLPYPDSDRLLVLRQHGLEGARGSGFVAPLRVEDWNRMSRAFQAISGYFTSDTVDEAGPVPVRIRAAYVAPRFIEVLGVSPVLGSNFTAEDFRFHGDAPGRVLISDRFWRDHFDRDPEVVGRSLLPDRPSAAVIGVMPSGFAFPEADTDLWFPVSPDAPYARNRRATWYTAIGRLRPGVTEARGRADLGLVQHGLAQQFPETDSDIAVTTQRLKDSAVGGARASLWLVFGAVSVLLLLACTNVAALLLARGIERGHEFGVRYSLGASRGAIVAQVVTETLLLALAGTAAGLAIAVALTRTLTVMARDLPRIATVGPDWRLFAYAALCTGVVTLLSGLLPAIHARSRGPAAALSTAGRTQMSGVRPAQWVLAGAQVALTVVLLVGAGLLLRSLQALSRVSPGFDAEHVLVFRLTGSYGETGDLAGLAGRVHRTLDALRALPGVRSAAAAISLPGVPFRYPVEVTSPDSTLDPRRKVTAESRWVSEGYFSTMDIPVLAGAPCDQHTEGTGALVNQSFASAYYTGTSPLGHHVVANPNPLGFRPSAIQGVVADARETGLDQAPTPTVYWCVSPPDPGRFYLLRAAGPPGAIARSVRETMVSVEPSRAVYDMAPLASRLGDAYADVRFRTVLLTLFAGTALSLASVGLYATLAYFVTVRRREIGLRVALGARRSLVGLSFLARGASVAAFGTIAGLAVALAARPLFSSMLYGVSSSDLRALSGAVAAMLAMALLASAIPAIRASRVDPMQILREQ